MNEIKIPDNWELMTVSERRDSLTKLEEAIKELETTSPPEDMFLEEWHTGDLYVRRLHIKKNTALVGEIHATRVFNILTGGNILIATEHGISIQEPDSFISEVGTKRFGFAIDDCVWTTFHPTQKTDVADIKEEILYRDFKELQNMEN
tara:strand:+ start:181 stop:624 length:444 start_codon:yes stop_codon:yes gene_type:complete